MQPPWEQNVSFKNALAIAAVQKRRFDEEIKQQELNSARLEQEIEQLKLELDKYKAEASPDLLLSTCFHLDSSSSPPFSARELEESSAAAVANFSLQLETLAISATLWTRAAEILSPDTHTFLCQVFNYTTRRKITALPSGNENAAGPPSSLLSSPLAAGTPTPSQALIQLTSDIIRAPPPTSLSPSTSTSISSSKSMEQILVNAALCLGQLCTHPHECLTLQDFSSLQEFISQLLTTACCSTSQKRHAVETQGDGEEENNKIQSNLSTTSAAISSENALCLLEGFQSNCGTGSLVLGCAAHGLQSFMQRLRGIVTGEIEISPQQPASLPLPSLPTTENELIEQVNEESLVIACSNIARLLQTCLRELPSWSFELPFQDEFLREIAAAVWDVSALSKVIAPAHPEVAKQGQRCAALLVSALQQMSSSPSRDDFHTTMNDIE